MNQCSEEGFHPLCIAAFWGYADIVKVLLEAGANVNVANRGTGWTAAHCAAFQGHGKVMLCLLNYKPDVTIADSMGRCVCVCVCAPITKCNLYTVIPPPHTPGQQLTLALPWSPSGRSLQQWAAGGPPRPSSFAWTSSGRWRG